MKNICGASIGDKTDASFCLKAAGTCTVTQHTGRAQSPWCKANRLYLKFAKQGKQRVSEVAIEPKEVSYVLEMDEACMENEFDDLQNNNHLTTWDADLKLCKRKEKAVACFHAFADSAVLIKEEATADLK